MAGRKQNIKNKKTVTVVFVEGDADELIIRRLLDYYRENGWRCQDDLEIRNINGFPYERKMKSKLTQILQTANNTQIVFNTVFCEYDTDIYEKGIQEKPDWKKVKDNLKRQYDICHFSRIEAKTSIEDWMLDDMDGLLQALGLPKDTIPKGNTGQEKVKNLFLKKSMVYDRHKGKLKIKPIIDKLDISKIREARKMELKDFEKLLGVNIFNKR
jgi:hypothetical protein